MITGGLQKRGDIWYAVYRQNGKQIWKSTGKTKKSDAAEVLKDLVAPLNAGDQARAFREAADAAYQRRGEGLGRTLRLDDVWQAFLASPERPDAGPVTLKEYKRQFERMRKWIGDHHPKASAVSDVSSVIASDFSKYLAGIVGAPTYNKNLQAFRLIWKTINIRTGWPENPWQAIALKRYKAISKRELTVEEIRRLLESDKGEWRLLFMIGTFTALRLADCATLRWDEVDLDQGLIIRVPRKTASRTGQTVQVPIFSELQAELQKIKAKARGPYVLPQLAQRYLRNHSSLEKHIGRIFNRAKIKRTADDLPGTRVRKPVLAGFHSLRHSFVSMCRSANAPEAVVMAIVGHGSPAMTRHYTHIGETAARAAISALPHIQTPSPAAKPMEPLPDWAAEALTAMTADNWKQTRDAMLARHSRPPRQPPEVDLTHSLPAAPAEESNAQMALSNPITTS